MSESVKPGTRCECNDRACADSQEKVPPNAVVIGNRCERDAVRMVLVVRGAFSSRDTREVPMCDPCASFHEAKDGAR